jgi:1,4-dihydroxy-2-naphthoyl-CoA hydrolase
VDEELTRLIRDGMPLAVLLGFEGVAAGPDAVTLRGTWSPERCTAAGVLHGGY